MCERQWDCEGKKRGCMFLNDESISFEEFYRRTRLCKRYHDNCSCKYTNKYDWISFVDFAELLLYPRAYIYKTAFELLRLKKKASEASIAIPEEIRGIVDWETINKCNETIREELRRRNTQENEQKKDQEIDFDKIDKKAKALWRAADRLPWRDEDEWAQFTDILNDGETCEAIDFESFRDSLAPFPEFRSDREEGRLIYEEHYSEENSGDFVPRTVTVSVEDKSMTESKSVDVLLQDEQTEKCIAIELKQWTESNIKPVRYRDIDPDIEEEKQDKLVGFKVIDSKGKEQDNLHPVIQAAFYAMLINNTASKRTELNINRPDSNNSSEVEEYIKHIIRNMPDGELSCIPLVYLHNQYYYNGLLYQLANDKEQILRSLYIDCLTNYSIKGRDLLSMYTHNECEKMIGVIKSFFAE